MSKTVESKYNERLATMAPIKPPEKGSIFAKYRTRRMFDAGQCHPHPAQEVPRYQPCFTGASMIVDQSVNPKGWVETNSALSNHGSLPQPRSSNKHITCNWLELEFSRWFWSRACESWGVREQCVPKLPGVSSLHHSPCPFPGASRGKGGMRATNKQV